MILFKHGNTLTLSIINRRLHKRDESKDVLEKVTLIKDIKFPMIKSSEIPIIKGGQGVVTHRAHREIIFDLSFDELKNKHGFTNFVELHEAWQKTLDIKELNKRFYEELFYWYLWAVKKVKFPQIRPKEDLIPDEAHQSESVIRLLTRLLFCWFMKEKQELIPEFLFDKKEGAKILIDFSPENEKSSVFYRAILQNLFFATLNVPIKNRKYIRESFQGKNKDYGNQYVYRYQSEFADAKENLKLFKDIPFLNGGLFECLDEVPENDDEKEIRLDGFSSKEEKRAFVPDYIFWDEHNGIDLSEELDNPRKKNETVHGVIDILNSYKFTIEENTPLEEEIALDPELLGKVFESLLAYYNPDTKANARKQTGSFYTPREIVNYMVDESLIAAFQQKLSNAGITENVELRLRNLISYNETENPFAEKETNVVIQALENLKVLDPACGSGAFPMGILHKLVWILRKVDPKNKIWFESIIKRLPTYAQPEMRKKLEGENWDYLRKLGIVQQSVYGVDIQPIAIQIAKLRFFISLLVDQDIKGNEQNNFGLFPLPNLDFKLVSANTLIGAPENYGRLPFAQDEFFNTFNKLTGQYFGTYEPTEKKNLTKKIKNLVSGKVQEKVDEIQRLSTHADERFSKHLAEKNKAIIDQKKNDAKLWKSYNNLFKHESVGFFEIKYFFPEVEDGFDVVIGNPPWGAKLTSEEKDLFKITYPKIDSSTPNTFSYFIGWAFKNYKGVISYVLPDSILIKDFAKTRAYIKDNISEIIWYENTGIPEEHRPFVYVDHDVCVMNIFKRKCEMLKYSLCRFDRSQNQLIELKYIKDKSIIILEEFEFMFNLIAQDRDFKILKKISKFEKLDNFMQCHEGIHTGNSREILFLEKQKNKYCHLLYYGGGAGDTIQNYVSRTSGWFVDYRAELIDKSKGYYASLRDERIFKFPKIYITRTGNPCKAFYDENTYASNNFFSLQHIDYSKNESQLLKFILPFILSKPAQYFIRTFAAPRLGSTFIETKIFHLLKFRVPLIVDKERKPIITLVDQILAAKQKDPDADTSALERQIDQMVYKLYGLTYEEVKIIEPEFAMSAVEYEAFQVK